MPALHNEPFKSLHRTLFDFALKFQAIMVIEDDCYFGVVYEALLGYRGLFANYFSLKSGSLSLKSHINVL